QSEGSAGAGRHEWGARSERTPPRPAARRGAECYVGGVRERSRPMATEDIACPVTDCGGTLVPFRGQPFELRAGRKIVTWECHESDRPLFEEDITDSPPRGTESSGGFSRQKDVVNRLVAESPPAHHPDRSASPIRLQRPLRTR